MIYENGVLLAQSERFPKGERRSVADVDLELLRSERLRMGTFDDNRAHHGIDAESFRRVEFELDPPAGDIGLRREVERFPFVPSDPARLEQDCYEAYNIQVSGLEQRLRALNYPKVVIGVSGGLDSTHALIVAARAMDREGRPRSDILAFTLPGFATGERTKGNAIALAEALGVTFEEIDIKATAELMLERDGPSVRAAARRSTTSPSRTCRPGLRTDYLFRLANQRGGIVLGTGDLSELALGLVHLRCRRPDVALQRQRRRAEDVDPAPDPLGHLVGSVRRCGRRGAAVGAGHRDHPGAGAAPARTRRSRAARPRSDRMCCRIFRCSRCCATGSGRRRSRSWPGTPGATPSAATGRRDIREDKRPAYSLKEIRHWLQVFVQRYLLVRSVQAVGDAQRSQGVSRRLAVTARRLAGPVGHVGPDLARRDRARDSRRTSRSRARRAPRRPIGPASADGRRPPERRRSEDPLSPAHCLPLVALDGDLQRAVRRETGSLGIGGFPRDLA